MKKSSGMWLIGIGIAALMPAGLKSASWLFNRSKPVEPEMAQAGEVLFKHVWKPGDELAGGDGLGPVFNADSCVACHSQNGPGGSGSLAFNVTTFTIRPMLEGDKPIEGVVHAKATKTLGREETLRDVHSSLPSRTRPDLDELVALPGKPTNRMIRMPRNVQVAQLNTPAIFGAKLIDDIPEREIIANERKQRVKWGLAPTDGEESPVGRASRTPMGTVGRFGWKGQTPSLSAFVQAACANELGLSNPGANQPRPLNKPDYKAPGVDLTAAQCDQITAFCASLPRPIERVPDDSIKADSAMAGKQLFTKIGCADCHTPDLGQVKGLYSDLLLHPMAKEMAAGGGYYDPPVPIPIDLVTGPAPSEWRTPPLWGVADSAPYMHDGRAATLEEAIRVHGGQGKRSSANFQSLGATEQGQLIAFLKTLRAPDVAKD